MNRFKPVLNPFMSIVIAMTMIIGVASAVHAGSFDGPFLELGSGFSSLGSKTRLDGKSFSLSDSQSQMNGLGKVAGGFSYELGSSFNLAAQVFYNFGQNHAGYTTYDHADGGQTVLQNKVKNIWGISVQPGYYLTTKTLAFLNLGWAQASTSLWENFPKGTSFQETKVGASNGFLYGLGFNHLLTDHIYVGMEAYQIAFNKQKDGVVNMTPNVTYAGVKVGFKF